MNIPAEQLPQSLHEIVDVIGVSATLKLVQAYPGIKLWIPADVDPEHNVAVLLGHAKARLLSERFKRTQIEIPRCVDAVRAARDAEIRRRYDNGETQSALALEYELTERRVREIVSKRGRNRDQLSLI